MAASLPNAVSQLPPPTSAADATGLPVNCIGSARCPTHAGASYCLYQAGLTNMAPFENNTAIMEFSSCNSVSAMTSLKPDQDGNS
jgi:hypothetical protein